MYDKFNRYEINVNERRLAVAVVVVLPFCTVQKPYVKVIVFCKILVLTPNNKTDLG